MTEPGSFLDKATAERIAKQLMKGRNGVMPSHEERIAAIEASKVFPFAISEEQMREDIEAAKRSEAKPKA